MPPNGYPLNVTANRQTDLLPCCNITTVSYTNKLNDVLITEWDDSEDGTHFIFGVILFLIFIIGMIENTVILIVFYKNHHIRTTINMYMIGLVVGDIAQLLLNIPLATITNLCGHWIFSDTVCQFYGFIITSFGISQIALFTVISVERYLIVVKHSKNYRFSLTRTTISTTMCYIYGSLCAIGPVIGWSRYDVELYGTTCSIRWSNRSVSTISYVMCLFTFGLFIPVIVMIWAYTAIALKMCTTKSKLSESMPFNNGPRRYCKEIRITVTILIMIGTFLFSWTPFAIVSFYTTIHGTDGIPRGLFMLPPIIAKSSIIWNPIIYVWRNTDFRKTLIKTMKKLLCRGVTNIEDQICSYTQENVQARRSGIELAQQQVELVDKDLSHHERLENIQRNKGFAEHHSIEGQTFAVSQL